MSRFRAGTSGNPSGRPRGAVSKATMTGREVAAGLLADPDYRRAFLEAWKARTVHPLTERMVWEFAHGKPPQAIALEIDRPMPVPLTINAEDGQPLTVIVMGVGSFERAGTGEAGEPLYRFRKGPNVERRPELALLTAATDTEDR